MTVVLSEKGWVRAAKGHEIDAAGLSYKTAMRFQAAARGRSNAAGRLPRLAPAAAISLPAHTLPSARGQGEPLTGRLNPPDGAKFAGVALGEPADLCLLVTDAGYGFTVKLSELITDRRAGKAILNVSDQAKVLPPQPVPGNDALIALVNDEGRLLVLPLKEVPELPRGKGNKLFDIPTKRAAAREETLVAVAVFAPGQKLVVWCGDRSMTLGASQLAEYRGKRAQRGALLSRNYRKVDRLEIE